MIQTIVEIIDYSILLAFGVFLSASFAGVRLNKNNNYTLLSCFAILGCIQALFRIYLSVNLIAMIYPIIAHLPLFLFLVFFYKKNPLTSIVSIMAAYLCCQISKWFELLALEIGLSITTSKLIHIAFTVIVFFALLKHITPSMNLIISPPTKITMVFAIMPIVYYIFDYVTTIYSDLLYSGSKLVFYFLPFLLCVVYFLFMVIYYNEFIKKSELKRQKEIMQFQNEQSLKEIKKIQKANYEMNILQHDMKHYLNSALVYLNNKDYFKTQQYLEQLSSEVNKIQIHKFCENEMVNMTISYYQSIIKQKNITFDYHFDIPYKLPCPEFEFTSILSNGLENAIQNIENIEAENRYIKVNLIINQGKLVLSIKNPYKGKIDIKNGLPVPQKQTLNIGTQSIKFMSDKIGGICKFSTRENIFSLRVVI